MEFKKYMHVEKYGNGEVRDIELTDGVTYIFPKIDGTNGSVWIDKEEICVGSRNRQLTLDNDNQGFMKMIIADMNIKKFLLDNPNCRLYGEFLIPHTLKTYNERAWKSFYVFDVYIADEEGYERPLHYDNYTILLQKYNINYIPPIAKIKKPTYDQLIECVESNTYLISNGSGVGEGIVIKNYSFVNRYGRTTWAKIVRKEFKEKHRPVKNNKEKDMIEIDIVNKYLTVSMIDKEIAKILVITDQEWESKLIPRLISTVQYEFLREEIPNAIKKFKYPSVNFRTLNSVIARKIKELKQELF